MQKPWREEGQPILPALTLLDPDHHAIRVDIDRAKSDDLAHTQARAIGDHEQRSVFLKFGASQESRDFFTAQHLGQLLGLAGKGDVEKSGAERQSCVCAASGGGVARITRRVTRSTSATSRTCGTQAELATPSCVASAASSSDRA